MKGYAAIIIAFGVLTYSNTALPADDAFPQVTQIGRWKCEPPVTPFSQSLIGKTYECFMAFPKGFADVPDLLVYEDPKQGSGGLAGMAPPGRPMVSLFPKEITADGFKSDKPMNFNFGGPRGDLIQDWVYSGSFIAVGHGPLHIRVVPKYLVLSVIYAPPGGPKGTNSIEYSESNTVGTSNSLSKTFAQQYSISFKGSGGFFGSDAGGGLGFTYTNTKTDKQSFDVELTKQTTITAQGAPSGDGVDNENDAIILIPNPPVDVQLGVSSILWSLADGAPAPTRVAVAWLKDPNKFQTDAPGVKSYLAGYGITETDYADILKSDPLAVVGSIPDPKRYVPLLQFMYTPPSPCEGSPIAEKVTLTHKNTSTLEQTSADEYAVDLSHYDDFSVDAAVGEFKGRLEEDGKWTWKTETSNSNSETKIDAISMSVGGPPCTSHVSPVMQAYQDTVYGTYAFRSVPGNVVLQGNMPAAVAAHRPPIGPLGEIIAHSVASGTVTVRDQSGQEMEIYPNSKGEWAVVGNLSYPVTVIANGDTTVLRTAPPHNKIDLNQK